MRTKLELRMVVVLIGCLCGARGWAQTPGAPATPPETRTLNGKAVDVDGHPVAGAHIMVRGGRTNVDSGTDGRFQITFRPPVFARSAPRLLARDPERNLVGFAEIGQDANLEVKMQPGLTVVATLKDPEGQPVTNGYAFFAVDPGFGDGEWVLDNRVPADEQGRLVDTALPRRSRVRVAIDAPHMGREELSAISNETDVAKFEFPPITMRRGSLKLAGRVVDTQGNPAAGIRLTVREQPGESATTDEKGNFSFDQILPGSVSVMALGRGVSGSASGRGGDTNLTVRLGSGGTSVSDATATITGMVLDTNGAPAEGILVMGVPGIPNIPGRAQSPVKTDAQGFFSVQWLALGGNASLVARDPARNLAAVARIDPRTTSRNLQLRPGLTLRGTVLDAAGKPLPEATLRLASRVFMMNDSVERANIPLNERGEFQVSGLPTDVYYTLTAQTPGHALDKKTVTEEQSRVNLLQLEPLVLKPLDHLLAGQVLDADGKPVSGAELRIANQHLANSSVYSDSHGHFQTVASEDQTKILAISPRGQGTINIDVTGGDTNVLIQFAALAAPGRALPEMTNTPGITLDIRCRTNVFKLGDEIPVDFIFTSHRTNDYRYLENADDSERPSQYKLLAKSPSGEMVPDPRGNVQISEEASRRSGNTSVIHPAESVTNSVLLNCWAMIREPGTYQIEGICTNRYQPALKGRSVPITISVLPRSNEEMRDYVSALANQVTERLKLQSGKTARAYDPRLHELARKLMFTGQAEVVPTLFRVVEESGQEGRCLHDTLAFYVPHTEMLRQALAREAAKDIPDANVRNWLLFALRNYSTNSPGTLDNLEPVGNASGISLEIRCTNQVLKAGDGVPIEFIVSNLGTEDYKYEDRSYDRSGRMGEYRLEAKAADGSILPDPREAFRAGIGGGLFQYGVLHPGESYSKMIPLNRWALVKDPGTYEVAGNCYASRNTAGSGGEVTARPIQISLLPRSSQELDAYISGLSNQIAAIVARRGTNTQPVFMEGLDECVMKLMYTCSPAAVPVLLETMYVPNQGFWEAEALLYYIPRSEEVGKAIGAVAARRGLASNMQYLLRQYGEGPTEDEMKQYIRRSLAADSPQTWAEGALAAQQYPDDAFNPRLIDLATKPKGSARMQAIYALARNRTVDGVKTLKALLDDPDNQIHDTAERAIRNAYTSQGNSRGRPLEPDDFDPMYQVDERSPQPRPVNLTGRPLPDLAQFGVAPTNYPAGRPLLVVLVDADQRPSRRALSLVAEQNALLKQKNVCVVVLQAAAMDDAAFAAWKQEAPPFPAGRLGGDFDRGRVSLGAASMPWLILTDEAHRVVAQGFAPDAIESQLATLRASGP